MTTQELNEIKEEIKGEQPSSPFINDNYLNKYILEAEYNINYSVGELIDYTIDLDARSLLKNYVLYANYKRLAEFKQLYGGDYAKLQAKYYEHTSVLTSL